MTRPEDGVVLNRKELLDFSGRSFPSAEGGWVYSKTCERKDIGNNVNSAVMSCRCCSFLGGSKSIMRDLEEYPF